MSAMQVIAVDAEGCREVGTSVQAIADATHGDGWVWVRLGDGDPDELRSVAAVAGLSLDAVRDSIRRQPRTRLSRYGDDALLVLQLATYDDRTETVARHEVDLLIAPRAIVAVAHDDLGGAGALLAPPAAGADRPLSVVWTLLERAAQGYREVIDGVENDVDEIEEQLFADDPAVSRRIFALQREVIDLAHAVSPLPDVLTQLHELLAEHADVGGDSTLHDLRARARYAVDRIAGLKHTLDDALQIHATLVNQRLDEKMADLTQVQVKQNDQVKKISSWAAIGFAPTLVASIYGMNFRFMPELDQPWGYPMALGLMVAVSVGLYAVFRRNDWL